MAKKNTYTQEGKQKKLAYIRKYNKKTYRSLNIMFRMDDPVQAELWNWIHTKYSTAGFLRDLAIAAMKNEKQKREE